MPLLAFLRCPKLKVLKCTDGATVDVNSWKYAGFLAFLKSCVKTADYEQFEVAAKFFCSPQQPQDAVPFPVHYQQIWLSLRNRATTQADARQTRARLPQTVVARQQITPSTNAQAREEDEHANKRRCTQTDATVSPAGVGQGARL
eukprot:GHVU01124889.1.p1 GENE.GHVU01124889.1~~GHVU01124889.1.p1  ORF type:complete len:145 (-),score=18.35 GHVU01124889.1:61-495(-)